MRLRAALTLYRALFVIWIIGLLFCWLALKQRFATSDAIVYAAATLVVFLALWWRRIYASPKLKGALIPFIFSAIGLAAWLRHDPHASIYCWLGAACVAIWVLTSLGLRNA